MALVATGYLAAIALVVWQHLYLPLHDDEGFYAQHFTWLQSYGWRASLASGAPVGYYAIVRLAGGDASYLFAGRAVSFISIGLMVVVVWRLTSGMASQFARASAVLAILNLTLAGHGFVFMATSDSLFVLVVVGMLLAVERAASGRRATAAVMAGLAVALAWTIRPIAGVYTVAIAIGLGVLFVRDPRRALTMRFAALLLSTCAAGVLLQQAPAIAAHGHLVFENKNEPGLIWAERRYLSRLTFEEHRGNLRDWVKMPMVSWGDVDAYKAHHGAQALPPTLLRSLAWSPWRTIRDFVVTLVLRDTFYFAGLLGLLFPLAWMRMPSTSDAATGRSMFLTSVLVAYVMVLTMLVSPFIEWRWLMPPLCIVALRGAFGLDRLLLAHPRAVGPLAILQLFFLCASLVFWTSRVLMVTG